MKRDQTGRELRADVSVRVVGGCVVVCFKYPNGEYDNHAFLPEEATDLGAACVRCAYILTGKKIDA